MPTGTTGMSATRTDISSGSATLDSSLELLGTGIVASTDGCGGHADSGLWDEHGDHGKKKKNCLAEGSSISPTVKGSHISEGRNLGTHSVIHEDHSGEV